MLKVVMVSTVVIPEGQKGLCEHAMLTSTDMHANMRNKARNSENIGAKANAESIGIHNYALCFMALICIRRLHIRPLQTSRNGQRVVTV